MNEEEFKECSVVAYPHEIRFLHIKGGRISYYVDRHISDYVNKLQEENQQLKKELEQSNAVADTNKELAESFHKENERLKSLLKCDYEDNQEIMADITKEKKSIDELFKRKNKKKRQRDKIVRSRLLYIKICI